MLLGCRFQLYLPAECRQPGSCPQIKKRHPLVKVVFGGANFEGEMGPEYVRAFSFIDYAVVGEGDIAFPALLRYLAGCKGENVVVTDAVPDTSWPEDAKQGDRWQIAYKPARSTSFGEGTTQRVLLEALQTSLPSLGIMEDMPFGVVMRTADGIAFSGQARPVRNMDAFPTPNYDEYFERARRLGLTARQSFLLRARGAAGGDTSIIAPFAD